MSTQAAVVERPDMEYVGFWPRVGASIIDALVIVIITFPPLTMVYGWSHWTDERFIAGPADVLLSWVFPAVATVWLWVKTGQTPGKMVIGAHVVDADTGQRLSVAKAIVRYLGYFVSMLALLLGYAWVGIDPRKQGWHDHMAGTMVIRRRPAWPEPVAFRD